MNAVENRCEIEAKTGAVVLTEYISVDEMAKRLSIARATAYQLTKVDGFPCFCIGKRIIIPLSTFTKWTEQQALKRATFMER